MLQHFGCRQWLCILMSSFICYCSAAYVKVPGLPDPRMGGDSKGLLISRVEKRLCRFHCAWYKKGVVIISLKGNYVQVLKSLEFK